MLGDLSFFRFNSNDASTKEKVVLLLSNEWPLTAKEIFCDVLPALKARSFGERGPALVAGRGASQSLLEILC